MSGGADRCLISGVNQGLIRGLRQQIMRENPRKSKETRPPAPARWPGPGRAGVATLSLTLMHPLLPCKRAPDELGDRTDSTGAGVLSSMLQSARIMRCLHSGAGGGAETICCLDVCSGEPSLARSPI